MENGEIKKERDEGQKIDDDALELGGSGTKKWYVVCICMYTTLLCTSSYVRPVTATITRTGIIATSTTMYVLVPIKPLNNIFEF